MAEHARFLPCSDTDPHTYISSSELMRRLTGRHPDARRLALRTALQCKVGKIKKESRFCSLIFLVVASGLEPPTPTLSGWCSNRLSYATIIQGCNIKLLFVGGPTLEEPALRQNLGGRFLAKPRQQGERSNRLSYATLYRIVAPSLERLV